ncbi:Glutamine amidotransferase type 1 [Burkholderia sp. lig30]|uniref:glutamine amidotransferase n=1 Tax=Burkholderia sp. lig30 TaxID=1192124 RepID=UPI00046177F4|nr:glutamine amidotransferase [Burkholderia sp. lig30]KDB10207.1 Glutamine amidotransferase type 1 [Burkholderia sp. lig30]
MNAEVVAIRHVHFEDLGSFEQVLGERGRRVRYVDVGASRVEVLDVLAPSLLVVLGGPVSVYDDAQYPSVAPLAALVKQRVDAGLPIVGICLGAQFIARALGARVYPAAHKELGWAPLTLTDAGRASALRHLDGAATSMLHWHGDTFDLPGGAIHLASTPACRNQAFAWGQHVLALQCHPEIRADRFEPWLIGNAGEIVATPGVDARQLRDETSRFGPALERAARRMFAEWLDGVGL